MRSRDISLDEFEPLGDEPSRFGQVKRTLSTVIGAIVALALLMAVGVWFYRLGVRDAENVPIIRAAAEPAKTRPEDPGGAVAPHQGITSYRVAESKPAQATAAVIAPPPPEPKREDVAMGTLAPAPAPAERPTMRVAPAAAPQGVSVRSPEPTSPAATAAEQPAAELAAGNEPGPEEAVLSLAEAGEGADPGALAGLAIAPAAPEGPPSDPVPDASGFAPPLSPVAPRRPTDLRERMAAAVEAAQRSASDLARRAAESQVQVQLAADPSEDVIRTMWRRISNANADLLHDRELAVQTTVSGGTTFYRLRVGPFGGVSEARAVCQALKARGQDCIVARNG